MDTAMTRETERESTPEPTELPKRSRKRTPGLNRFALVLSAMVALTIVGLTGCERREHREIDFSDRIDDAELALLAPKPDSEALRFGFDLRGSPEEDARQYLPLLNYLEGATGLRFSLRFTPMGSTTAVNLLGTGELDLAAIGAASYLVANERYGVIPLARGLNAHGRAEYQSVIVVAPASSIRKIEDLRGKSVVFSRVNSTQGHLIPRISLAEHGLSLVDLAEYEYSGSHQSAANAVAAGQFDAGGIQDILGRRLVAEGHLRIISTSEFYPSSGIVANKVLAPDVIEKVREALLDFRPAGAHAAGLYHWDRTEMAGGFGEAHDGDYAELREWSLRFGLLDAPAGGGGR
jgi:phosphonate transport system substrate-binding protein